jgi:hypothetical protein
MVIFCLFLSSCGKQKPCQQKEQINQPSIDPDHQALLEMTIQQEAMLTDIPIPLYDERVFSGTGLLDAQSDENRETSTLTFGYKSPLSCAQAQDFFMNQMERYGWQHMVTFSAHELLLIFSTPHRYCSIIIRPTSEPAHSLIFIYIKKSELESSPMK